MAIHPVVINPYTFNDWIHSAHKADMPIHRLSEGLLGHGLPNQTDPLCLRTMHTAGWPTEALLAEGWRQTLPRPLFSAGFCMTISLPFGMSYTGYRLNTALSGVQTPAKRKPGENCWGPSWPRHATWFNFRATEIWGVQTVRRKPQRKCDYWSMRLSTVLLLTRHVHAVHRSVS